MRAKILILILLVAAVGAGLFIGIRAGQGPGNVELSADQREIIEEAGYPDTFSIIILGDRRDEIWNYYSLQASFYFTNGEYVRADSTLELLPENAELPKLKPMSFPAHISLTDIGSMTGNEPVATTKPFSVKELGTITGYQYPGGLFVGTRNSEVSYVTTQAYRKAGP